MGQKISYYTNYPYMGIPQETIIFRLIIKNPGFGLSCHFRYFGPCCGLKMAWPHRYPYGSGTSKPNQKVDPLGGPFGSPVTSKLCFQLFWSVMSVDIILHTYHELHLCDNMIQLSILLMSIQSSMMKYRVEYHDI